jgi:hypothetical protein
VIYVQRIRIPLYTIHFLLLLVLVMAMKNKNKKFFKTNVTALHHLRTATLPSLAYI